MSADDQSRRDMAHAERILNKPAVKLEEARRARDIAEADRDQLKKMLAATKGLNFAKAERLGVRAIAAKAAHALPPDVLTSPMPLPDRLEYAEAVIVRAIIEAITMIRS